jgi:hypothetical protein
LCSLVAGELVEGSGVENAIKDISAEEIPELLMAIARRWKSVDHASIYVTSPLMQLPR